MSAPVLPGLFDVPVKPLPRPDPVSRVIAATAAKAERAIPDFVDRACAQVLASLAHGPQSGETLVAACRRAGIVPEDDRAFGAVFRRLSQQGQIVTVGYTTREKGHGTAGGRVWARR